jgi:hypothetical protein
MRTLYVSLLTAAALAFAGLVAPAISLAAECPPGQTGTPPYCVTPPPPPPTPTPTPTPTPPPPVVAGSVSTEPSGFVKLTFDVAGPGVLTLKGNAIKGLKITVNAAGQVEVTLKPDGKVLQHLTNRGWTRPKQIFVTFTGTDGTKSTIKVVVRFRKQ